MPERMPDLSIRMKKKTDGAAAFSCTRPDGTVTWQRQDGQLGNFFPHHDLTHLAVESVLGLRRAFYGLLAEGWDISSFAAPENRGRLPHEALFAELIVGYFDLERRTGDRPTATQFNEGADEYFRNQNQPAAPFKLTQEQVDRIRALRAELFAKWDGIAAGEVLELSFDRAPDGDAAASPRERQTQTRRQSVG